ncbi:S8 family serine peptidase [Novosphingobium sp. SL115]|uniref:S8 family serine peptidase n=1 Tax=Novosphingobium sp. SL115 TaxID=2995150 RepID=UPI00227372FC|nr:S8 family serine peptidase [Novosphingobium sp. SL115]MCY1671956.1 S8 family serine peptidase [Novosphingobium sp. SL115]
MRSTIAASLAMVLAATPAMAQLALPGAGDTLGQVNSRLDGLLEQGVNTTRKAVDGLTSARIDRLAELVRNNRQAIEFDAENQPARRGELLLEGADSAAIARAEQAGFVVIAREDFQDLGLAVVRLAVPPGAALAQAEKRLRKVLPGVTISSDQLYFASGNVAAGSMAAAPSVPGGTAASTMPVRIGVIDGAPGPSAQVAATQGFARGAPLASNHGSAVVSLLLHAGARDIAVADVYGNDPAGGNAFAIVRALGWLLTRKVRVVSISLVGPRNAVLAKAISAVQGRGMVVVAAVGNDGPAAPPSYPASYPGVIAVTAVDGRNRALIEAGRALHLDYAAPGADMLAANAAGQWKAVRGTSFATPLVAARAARAVADRGAKWLLALDGEARDLGRKGPDPVFGRGLVCGSCRRTK